MSNNQSWNNQSWNSPNGSAQGRNAQSWNSQNGNAQSWNNQGANAQSWNDQSGNAQNWNNQNWNGQNGSSQGWSNLGEQFKSVVQSAIDSGDFRELNDLVTGTVTSVISEAGKQVKIVAGEVKKEVHSDAYKDMYAELKQYEESQKQRKAQAQQDIQRQREARRNFQYQNQYYGGGQNVRNTTVTTGKSFLPAAKIKNVGQVSSVLYMVFGGIGLGLAAIALFVGCIFGMAGFAWSGVVYVLLMLTVLGFSFMIRKGCVEDGRLKRMKRYVALCAGKMYVNIEDLAKQVNKSAKYVLKDVKKMLRLGFFPEGHLDEQGTCLMLDDATYREYLRVEKERRILAQEQLAQKNEAPKMAESTEQSENTDQELQTMLREGKDYIDKLHHMNDLIEGESISEKLYRMEALLKEIFDRVAEHPQQMPQMHKLMNYYLPTTLKLLQAYEEFDGVSAPGEEIVTAKAEIERTVDTINEAFAELLNKLFQATVFDVTTDAQVLQTMLAKEGLTKEF